MQTIEQIHQKIAPLFSPIIGNFRLKTYFSYYAVFKGNLMIALCQEDKTYLRISLECIQEIENLPGTHTLSDKKIGLQSKKFYFIPPQILSNETFISHLLQSAIFELEKEREKINQKRLTQIRHLPNMNIKLERMLKKIGILSIQEFSKVGYLSTFIQLVTQGYTATEELLFKLNGALNNQYIYTFTENQKQTLMLEANKALYEAGLRRRFTIQQTA